jgi:hypothetical protein
MATRDFQALRRALRQQPTRPGTMRAAINYYRVAFRANPLARVRSLRRVDIPTLII